MRSWSFLSPIIRHHILNHPAQGISFGHRKISFLVLGKSRQQKDRKIFSTKEINNARPTTLAATAEAEPHLANSAASRNNHAASGVGSEPVYDCLPLVRRKKPFRSGGVGRGLDERL